MPQEHPPKTTPLQVGKWDTAEIFDLLEHPLRRAIIRRLAFGGKMTALDASAGMGQRRHTCLKHLSLLCKGEIVVQRENPKDRRQPIVSLAPSVVVCDTGDAITTHFGCCMLRFAKEQPK